MKVVALISGGKDSTFNMMQCIAAGHEIVALANLCPHSKTELDSFMYQTVGHEAIDLIAAAIDLPLYKKDTMGISYEKGKIYKPSENDEVEDLYSLLQEIKNEIDIEAVSVGAILSDYQRVRVENVCSRLGLTPLAYLWQRNQEELLDEMIRCEVDAVLIKVACLGLETKHLGRSLSLMQPHLLAMHEKYGVNVCGEGGEYETLTLDCPLFKSRIVIEDSELVFQSDDVIAPVGYLSFKKLSLELKLPALDLPSRLEGLPLKDSDGYLTDLSEEALEVIEKVLEEDEEEDISNSPTNNVNYFPVNTVQKPTSIKSKDGWLWIGGIQGHSSDSLESMTQSMSILKSELSVNGHSIQDVCSVTMFINDIAKFGELNKLYQETFDFTNPPTRACVQVPFNENCPVRIETLSWRQTDNVSGDKWIERQTMHVQSRSHWAPANIGPYSQCVRVRNFVYLAGQIGLVPGNMEMVEGGIKSESRLALRHLKRLLKAMDSNFNLSNVVQGICYLADESYIKTARKMWESRTNNALVEYVVVTGLPKDCAVEWHVWAHKYNNQFDYEEKGKCIGEYSISIYRRWNHESKKAAILCHVGHPGPDVYFDSDVFREAMSYTIGKLRQGHEEDAASAISLRIFYSIRKIAESSLFEGYFDSLPDDVAISFTLVPVVSLRNEQTILSICGVKVP